MKLILFVFLVIAVILPLFGNAISLTVDWLWFKELNLESVFLTTLLTKAKIGALTTIVFIIIAFINIYTAMSLGRRKTPVLYYDIIEIPVVEQYRSMIDSVVLIFTALI